MSLICPACKTANASDATVCAQCAAALPVPPRMSLLEQAMAKPAAKPVAEPVPPPAPAPAAPESPKAAPVPAPAPVTAPAPLAAKSLPSTPAPTPKPAPAHSGFTMPPLPPQPRPRRRSRAPWILAIVLFLALVAALGYEALQANGVSLPSLRSLLPSSASNTPSP